MLAADISVFRADRVPAPGGPAYPLLAPDLVVETAAEASQHPKARLWLARGVRLVWVLWPRRHAIDVWTPGTPEPSRLGFGDELDGGDVVPGFRVPAF